MNEFSSRYINPFTDFGFKKLFGQEANKDLLIDFLNQLLPEEQGPIKSLTYLKTEQLGTNDEERLAIFDLHCENEKGETFIVELQQAYQKYFKDRALFYSTYPIREQGKKNEWNFRLEKVFTIAILNFTFPDGRRENDEVKSVIKLMNVETKEAFYDKLTFIYLEMPKFTKTLEELNSKYDKWLYILSNLGKLKTIPKRLQERIFMKLFEEAEIARFTPEQAESYKESLKHLRDYTNTMETAKEIAFDEGKLEGKIEGKLEGKIEGKLEGKIEGKLEVAQQLLSTGFTFDLIQKITGLSENDILRMRDENS